MFFFNHWHDLKWNSLFAVVKKVLQTQTPTLLYDLCNGAGFISSHDENILQTIQDDLHHLGVLHWQQVAERWDNTLFHQELHLHVHTKALKACDKGQVQPDLMFLVHLNNPTNFSTLPNNSYCLNPVAALLIPLTWSFLPLMVRLLMAHAASFWVPKSPCGAKACHWDVHIDAVFTSNS